MNLGREVVSTKSNPAAELVNLKEKIEMRRTDEPVF